MLRQIKLDPFLPNLWLGLAYPSCVTSMKVASSLLSICCPKMASHIFLRELHSCTIHISGCKILLPNLLKMTDPSSCDFDLVSKGAQEGLEFTVPALASDSTTLRTF